jgi:hypothetical protein
MTTTTIIIFLGTVGLAALLFASVRKAGIRQTATNATRPRPLTLFLITTWLVGLAVAVRFSPPKYLLAVVLGSLAAGAIILFIYHLSTSTLPPSRPLAIGYIPAEVRYWLCKVDMPTIMRVNTTYMLSLGLTSHWVDIRPNAGYADPSTPEGRAKLDEVISDPVVLKLSKYAEEAMVASGQLLHNVNVKVLVDGPAFSFDTKQYDANIEDLEKTPLRIACLPNRVGRHHIVFNFLDCSGQRCGGIAVPVDIREREPLISDRVLRAVQIIGAIIALVTALLVIADKVRGLWLR